MTTLFLTTEPDFLHYLQNLYNLTNHLFHFLLFKYLHTIGTLYLICGISF